MGPRKVKDGKIPSPNHRVAQHSCPQVLRSWSRKKPEMSELLTSGKDSLRSLLSPVLRLGVKGELYRQAR